MRLAARHLNRATLDRQLLLSRRALSVPATVRRIAAIQAQHPASVYLALWNRMREFDPAKLDSAFRRRSVVRGTGLRMTLQVTDARDYACFRDAIEPTMFATHLDGRFTPDGLSVEQGRAILEALMTFAEQPRTVVELTDWLEPRIGAVSVKDVWAILRQYASLVREAAAEPWSFGQRPSFRVAPHLPSLDLGASDPALQEFLRRYAAAYGPSTPADVAQFALVQQTRVKAALKALGDEIVWHESEQGVRMFDLAGARIPDADTPAPARLLPMWDNALLAHKGRERLIPPGYRRSVIRANGDLLPTMLVDGRVAGVWRVVDGGIEATAFERLDAATWRELETEAAGLADLLGGRERDPYRRYARWWDTMPADRVRLISAKIPEPT